MSDEVARLPFVSPGRGALRLTRVALFALGAVGLASSAHLAGGEQMSPLVALLAVPAVMVAVNLMASGRRGRLSLLVAMGLSQVALHLAFMATSVTQTCHLVPGAGMARMPMRSGQAAALPLLHCDSSMAHDSVASWFLPSPAMLGAHVIAMVLLVLLLAHGERAVWALASSLRFHFLLPGRVLVLQPVRRLSVPVATAFRPRSAVHRRSVRRRGPPRLARAVP